jgi:prepilin-type N-terminal cleavage/methylation domain-containing protein
MTQAMTVQNKKNIRKNRKGFTLIELIVVIAILAILAAIAIPAFTGSLNNAKERTDQASARVLVSAVQLYRAEDSTVANTHLTPTQLEAAGYIEAIPQVQSGTGPFVINYNNTDHSITNVQDSASTPATFYPVP